MHRAIPAILHPSSWHGALLHARTFSLHNSFFIYVRVYSTAQRPIIKQARETEGHKIETKRKQGKVCHLHDNKQPITAITGSRGSVVI
jgi:hypothetical protein